jgi:esterase/lipase superfamily enzyme
MNTGDSFARELLGIALRYVVPAVFALAAVGFVYERYVLPTPYAGVTLQQGIRYVSARRFEQNGLEDLIVNGSRITLEKWTPDSIAASGAQTVTIFVHGYNAREAKVATYFSGLLSELQERRPRGHPLIVFDWPSIAIPLDELPASQRVRIEAMGSPAAQLPYEASMYAADRRQADSVGRPALLKLLESLQAFPATVRINIVAHSMGCHVVASAMLARPAAFARVSKVIWLAPDVDQAIVAQKTFLAALPVGMRLSVLHASTDTLLGSLSALANGTPRLGASGPPLGWAPPGNIEFIDMSAALGTKTVHSRYLDRDSPAAAIVEQRLSGLR